MNKSPNEIKRFLLENCNELNSNDISKIVIVLYTFSSLEKREFKNLINHTIDGCGMMIFSFWNDKE